MRENATLEDPMDRARHHGGDPEAELDLSASLNPLGPPRVAWEALSECIERRETLTRYPDPEYRELRRALAEFYGVPDWRTIVAYNGADEALHLATLLLTRPTGALMVLVPNYGDWHLLPHTHGTRLLLPRLVARGDTWAPDGRSLREAITQAPRAPLLASSPNNPTGSHTAPQLLPLLEQAGHQGTLLLDEAYAELCPTCPPTLEPPSDARHPRLVRIRSLTKWLALPGLRIGFAHTPDPTLARKLDHARPAWNINGPTECTTRKLLTQYTTELRQHQRETRRYIQENIPHLAQALKQHGLTPYKTTTNYILAHTPRATQLIQALRRQGIAVRDASTFTGLGPGHIRIALPPKDKLNKLLQALQTCC